MIPRPSRRAVVRSQSIPAPVGGLNARDAIANMKPTDAIIMDNWFPETADVRIRNGYTKWATGFPAAVESLMCYSNGAGRRLFAASGAGFYECTNTGAIGAAAVTGLSNARWQHVNVGTAGGQFLYAVNGVDYPQLFNGSTWQQITNSSSPISVTGVDPRLLTNINIFKNRVWFIEKNSMRVWYLPVNSVGGAATSIDFSPLFKMGGSLLAMVTWTIDNASSIDDYAAFVSTEGEVALYRGTDPASASTWALAGMFRIGRPVGNRSFVKYGSDVIIVCADGFFPLSKALLTDRSQIQDAISDKIVGLANTDVATYSGNFGWQVHLHPISNKLIVNVPAASGAYQYVMNTITGAWCRFTGWTASCFESFGDKLMFGGSNYVAWADQGNVDDASAIIADLKPAFSYFGSKLNKRFTMVRPLVQVDGTLNLLIDLNTDFANTPPQSSPTISQGGSAQWNTSPWDLSTWQAGTSLRSNWQTVFGIGYAATLRMRCTTKNQAVFLQSIDYVFEQGGIL